MLIQQPVPFACFHILKVQILLVLMLVGYSVTCVFEDEWYFSMAAYAFICFVLIGLQEIAVAMADPFGSDDMDFETNKIIETTYINVLGYLREDFRVRSTVRQLPSNGLVNPLHLEGPDAGQHFCNALFAHIRNDTPATANEESFKVTGSRWKRKRKHKRQGGAFRPPVVRLYIDVTA
jgi:hypothetical protein